MTKYEYLFDADNKLVHNSEAIRLNEYRLYPGEPLDYIYKQGDEREYFAKKIESNNVFGFVGVKEQGIYGESPEHYNAKMKIVHEKKYFDTIFNQWIEFDLVVPEFYHDIKKRPDLSCYDAKNKLVCCIEICWSNAKTDIDIIKLKELKVPIIEIHLKNENRSKHLVLTNVLESNREKLRVLENEKLRLEESYKRFSEEKNTDYSRLVFEVEKFERESEEYIKSKTTKINNWLQKRLPTNNSKQRGFFKTKLSKQNRIDFNLEEIDYYLQERLKRFTSEPSVAIAIKETENRISKSKLANEKLDYRIGKLESEIETIKSRLTERRNTFSKIAEKSKIEWFRNQWMINKPQNLIQEIKYWLC